MRVIAIDPDSHRLAFSVWDDGVLIQFGKVYCKSADTFDPVFFTAMESLARRADILVIEDQYIPRDKPERFYRMKDFLITRGAIEYEFNKAGVQKIIVTANSWQSKVLKRPGSGRITREIAKSLSRKVATDIVRKHCNPSKGVQDDDLADAICIGYWFHTDYQRRHREGIA